MRFLPILVACVLAGCNGGEDDKDGTDKVPGPGNGSGEDCGNTAPEVSDLRITDAGQVEFGEGSAAETWPAIRIEADAYDVDGDLTFYIFDLWWDETTDGTVDVSGEPMANHQATVSSDDCSVTNNTVGLLLAITGAPPLDRDVEFGVIVSDAEGNPSNNGEPLVELFHTPAQ